MTKPGSFSATKNNAPDIPVLFTADRSVYDILPGFDPWPASRNALNYHDHLPVIAHPPCRLFGRLRSFSNAPASEKELAYFAIRVIRRLGGVLEHPESSTLWAELSLPKGLEIDNFGGFTMSIDQHWFGHKARKRTWLYIVGCRPAQVPDYPILFDYPTHTVSKGPRSKPLLELSAKARSATPVNFALWLQSLVRFIAANKPVSCNSVLNSFCYAN
jgi:hypothetical protein